MSNLLPKTQQRQVVRLYIKRLFATGLILFALCLVASSALLIAPLVLLSETDTVLRTRKAELLAKETGAIEAELKKAVTEVNERLNIFSKDTPKTPLSESTLSPVFQARGSSITISGITYAAQGVSSARIDVAGIATTREALLAFTERLRAYPQAQSVSVPVTNFIRGENVQFVLSMIVTLK